MSVQSPVDDRFESARWFAIWTRSRHEHLVCRGLDQRHLDTFLPTVPRWSVRKSRRKTDSPLFPGYCFARFAFADRLRVLNCPGVANIVSVAGEPAPIPEDEIEGVRKLVNGDLQYDPCPFLREGARVEVVRGPLTGVVGRLLRRGSHAHLVLAVDLVGGAVSVQVDAGDVVAI